MALLIPTFFCPKAWESMSGDDKVRHCSYCNKSVHNLGAMTARERLALLSSPAAGICSRYKVALRRPVPGRRESYARHLLKYGIGVAATGSVLLVLWEMYERGHRGLYRSSYYRAVAPTPTCGGFESIPDDWYEERQLFMLGAFAIAQAPVPDLAPRPSDEKLPEFVDLKLDPVQLQGLIKAAPVPAASTFPLPTPTKKKKAGRSRPWFGLKADS